MYYNNGGRRNNSFSNNKSWSPRYNYSNNYDFRGRLKRYRHQPRDSKNEIEFEYNITDCNILSNLRRTMNSLKKEPQASRDRFKRVIPKMMNRSEEEVCEDSIATISINQIQNILSEDLDLVSDALVTGDYIDEVDA